MPEELLNQIYTKINQIAQGRNIGTSLQADLEEEINAILPEEMKYYFDFNMNGMTHHIIEKDGQLLCEF